MSLIPLERCRARAALTGIFLLASAYASPALAQADTDSQPAKPISGFYLGGGLNWGGIDVSNDDCIYFYYYSNCETNNGDNEFGYSLDAGYRFNRYFALEGGYVDYRTLGYDDTLSYVPDLFDFYNTDIKVDMTATYITAVGIVPAGNGFDVYFKGGAVFYDATSRQRLVNSFDASVVDRTIEDDDTELFLAIGIGYSFSRFSQIRLEVNGYSLDDSLVAIGSDRNASITNIVLDYQIQFGGDWKNARGGEQSD